MPERDWILFSSAKISLRVVNLNQPVDLSGAGGLHAA
jgi:hypothetical protein